MSVQLTNPAFNTNSQPDQPSTIVIGVDGTGTASGPFLDNIPGLGADRQLFGLQITAGDVVTITANAGVGTDLDTVLKVFLPDITA